MPNQDQLQRLLAEMIGSPLGGAGYPTKEEIMDGDPKHKPEVIKLTKQWKKEVWFPLRATEPTDEQKFEALKTLLTRLAQECY